MRPRVRRATARGQFARRCCPFRNSERGLKFADPFRGIHQMRLRSAIGDREHRSNRLPVREPRRSAIPYSVTTRSRRVSAAPCSWQSSKRCWSASEGGSAMAAHRDYGACIGQCMGLQDEIELAADATDDASRRQLHRRILPQQRHAHRRIDEPCMTPRPSLGLLVRAKPVCERDPTHPNAFPRFPIETREVAIERAVADQKPRKHAWPSWASSTTRLRMPARISAR